MNKLLTLTALLLGLTACGVDEESMDNAGQAPEAPYAVGSTTRFIHDSARPFDAVAGVDEGVRILIAEIWYPVDRESLDAESRKATWGDYVFGDPYVHRLMMTKTTFFHLTPETVRDGVSNAQIDAAIDELFQRQRMSYVDAPLAAGPHPWPVVVMTHGDAGSRYNMQSACEHLAAHGYVVIAPEHTGNSPYSMIGRDPALADDGGDPQLRAAMAPVLHLLDEHGVYGREEHYGQSYTPLTGDRQAAAAQVRLDRALLQRVNDLRAALAELERMNATGRFEAALDLDRIGLMGRSFGASTTLAALSLEARFTAGFAVVPPSLPDPRPQLPSEMLIPAGEESVILSADGPYAMGELGKPTMLLSGGEDDLIIGLAASAANAADTEPPAPDNRHPVLRAAYEQSAAPVVWGELANSNHASFGVSGGYWWPDLKPDRFPSYFDPGSEYELIDVVLAHRIQKEKALAFFDLMIRQDKSARARLLDNPYANAGLVLESRNLPST